MDGGREAAVDLAELLDALGRLRRATTAGQRAPHKPLLLLWLFARFQQVGSSAVSYVEAEGPVSDLINEFGPPMRSPSAAGQRAAMPFVHLERELWSVTSANGEPLPTSTAERRGVLLELGARGQLRPEVEAVLGNQDNLSAAGNLILDQHFTPTLARLITETIGLDLAIVPPAVTPVHRRRSAAFAETVRRAYAYQCAMCGFDGALARTPVALEAAHVQWHSQDGPDDPSNGVCLCELHHALFDLGVLGLTADRKVTVSPLYVARTAAGRAVDQLAGVQLARPRGDHPVVDLQYIRWHTIQVFKVGDHAA